MSAPIALQVARGEDILFSCVHQVSQTNNAGVDISGWTITVTVKDTSGAAALSKPGTLTTPTSGLYTWAIVSADTLALKTGTYLIDIWRVDVGSKRQMGFGTFTIMADELFSS